MSNVIIDINTTINAPVINIEESVYSVAINSEITTNNNTINVNSTAINNVIEVSTQDVRAVTIDIERGVVPDASPTVKGKMKLYSDLGTYTDGAINQNTVSNNFSLKVDKAINKSLVLDTEIVKISHTNRDSLDLVVGTNTGDQDLSDLATTTYVDSQNSLKVDKVVGKSLILNTEALRFTKFSGGQAEIDFGALPIYQKEFTITDASVLTTSNITASIAYEAPTGKDLDEIEMDSLDIICGQATNGTFKIIIKSIDGSYLADKFKINYSITT